MDLRALEVEKNSQEVNSRREETIETERILSETAAGRHKAPLHFRAGVERDSRETSFGKTARVCCLVFHAPDRCSFKVGLDGWGFGGFESPAFLGREEKGWTLFCGQGS